VLSVDPFVAGFASHSIEFVEVQPEGKKAMSGRDFANGFRVTIGMSLIA
jgi:methionyl-tRNA formyltransferase